MSRVKQKQSLSRTELRGYGGRQPTDSAGGTSAVRWTRFATADGVRLGVAVEDGSAVADLTGTEVGGVRVSGADPLVDLLRAGVALTEVALDGAPRRSVDDVH